MAENKYSIGILPLPEQITQSGGRMSTTWENWFVGLENQFLIRWEDLRFPASGFDPAGSTAPPTLDTATGLLSFSGVLDNIIGGAAQMPHAWLPGTTVRPHLHLRFPTSAAANTRWRFEYDRANANEDFTNASGTYTLLADVTIANPQNVNRQVVAGFGDLPMVGFRESAIILWKITRLAFSDAADNDVSACLFIEFDIHFQIEKRGTVSEYPT